MDERDLHTKVDEMLLILKDMGKDLKALVHPVYFFPTIEVDGEEKIKK